MLIAALAAALTFVSAPSPPTDLPLRPQRPLVVIVLPKSHNAAEESSVEASVRLRGELDSAGVEVRTIDSADTPDTPEDLGRIAREYHAVAAIALVWVPGVEATDLWIADRMTGNFVHRRVDATSTGEKSVELLAIRTAELIRASLVDIFVPPAPPTPTPAPPPPTPPPPTPPPPTPPPSTPPPSPSAMPKPNRWRLRAGAGPALMLTRGATPSFAPMLDVGALLDQKWLVRAVAAGFGSDGRIGGSVDWAGLRQDTVSAQVQYRRRVGKTTMAADLGAGFLHVTASGHTAAPYDGVNVSRTAFCGVGGLALYLALGSRLELSVEGQALMAAPAADIWALSSGPAKSGQPTVLVMVGLAVLP
jgi:hypothetical protein